MGLYVYITEECARDAENHSLVKVVETAKRNLEVNQRVVGFQDFPSPFIRKRSGNLRLIATRHEVGEDTVIAFLRIFTRDGSDYRDFLDDRDGFRNRFLLSLMDDVDLQTFVSESRVSETVQELPEPSSEEQAFLFRGLSFRDADTGDVVVCETQQWVDAFKGDKLTARLSEFNKAIIRLVGEADGSPGIQAFAVSAYQIMYRWFPSRNRLLLVAIAPQGESIDARLETEYGQLVNQENPSTDEIGRAARRTYPQLILADEDAWFAIQRNAEANLALSFEETQVLYSADSSQTNELPGAIGFPLFVNGRAGSGKSTILQYLFADYLAGYLAMERRLPEAPAYFTYNTELLERAKSVVGSLLNHGSQFLVSGQDHLDLNRDREVINSSFRQLQRFFHSLLPAEVRRKDFKETPGKYVNYARYKDLWERQFGKVATSRDRKEFGPDISWHVIRSYIKGMSLEPGEPLDPDDYSTLPQKRRTVTESTYKRIFDKVYVPWYREIREDGFWDDQDLAHALLEADIKPRFPAIFCDEAQDFTPLELEVLYRLSIFSARKLHSHLVRRVPLVFAGDPFQTLNPTGFSWDAIKANYTTKLLDNSSTDDTYGPQINYRELEYNYRSTWPIVKLSNTLQALRSLLLDVTLRPQTTWGTSQGGQNPLWYDLEKEETKEQLRRQKELTIIVPVDEGEEAGYVKNDPVLSSIVDMDDSGTPMNVLSPMRAKGLEFNRVALYGFGTEAPNRLLSILDSAQDLSPEERLPLEYFVNRLYVAASRPKRRLFIIDPKEALGGFWSLLQDKGRLHQLADRLKNPGEWKDKLGVLQEGHEGAWDGERENPKDLADRYRKEGESKADPFLLRQAAFQYEQIQENTTATRCRAAAFELEGDPERAAREYLKVPDVERAVRSIWRSGNLSLITSLFHEQENLGDSLEVNIVKLLQKDPPNIDQGMQLIAKVVDTAERDDALLERIVSEGAWGESITDLALAIVMSFPEDQRGTGTTKTIASRLRTLQQMDAEIDSAAFAYVQYMAGNDDDALGHWNDVGTKYKAHDFSKQLARLNAANLPITESIARFAELGDFEGLLRAYKNRPPDTVIDQDSFVDVAVAAAIGEDHEAAAEAVSSLTRIGNLIGVFSEIVSRETTSESLLAVNTLDRLLELMVDKPDVLPLALLVTDNEFFGKKDSDPLARKSKQARQDYLRANRTQWLPKLFDLLSQSDAVANLQRRQAKALFTPLKAIIMDQRHPMQKHLPLLKAGAIVERLGGDVEALEFYEAMLKQEHRTQDEKDKAGRRWIAVKERQAKEHADQGKTNNASRYQNEARDRRRELGLGKEERLPKYPQLDTAPTDTSSARPPRGSQAADKVSATDDQRRQVAGVSLPPADMTPTGKPFTEQMFGRQPRKPESAPQAPIRPAAASSPSRPIEFRIGSFSVSYYVANSRLNVVDSHSGDSVTIRPDQEPASDDVEVRPNVDGSFDCIPWSLRIEPGPHGTTLRKLDSDFFVTFPKVQ